MSNNPISQLRDIDQVRQDIDEVDRHILELLAERRRLSLQIARSKEHLQHPFRDRAREEEVISDRVAQGRFHDLDSGLVHRIWRDIIEDSLLLQQEHVESSQHSNGRMVIAAIQGIEGSYSQLASEMFHGRQGIGVSHLACDAFADVVAALEQGRADVAVLPIENTTSGGISEVYDLLMHTRLWIVGEIKFRVRHCLLAVEGASLADLRTIYCHPQAVVQCSNFLAELRHCTIVYFGDTALSGKWIKELSDPTVAAIASEEAARLYGLRVLRSGIGNRDESYTRFVIAARAPVEVNTQVPTKTSLVMSVGNQPGALVEALAVFRDEGINLVKLESRPVLHDPWQEMFYVDLDGNLADLRVAKALKILTTRVRYLRVLGSYPSNDLRPRRSAPPAVLPRSKAPRAEVTASAISSDDGPTGYRLASRVHRREDTVVEVQGVEIGSASLVMIAGPCAVESFEQIMECAAVVKGSGGNILRGGCFKPRTSPYSFQGLGLEGLEMLAEAGRVHGLPIVTEVLASEDVARVAEVADILQIGTRNMQNFKLLSAVGSTQRPVLLKRGMGSSLEELLQAAEYILDAGNQQVILCERGIRTFETTTRNTLDLSAVPVLKRRTHLPVVVDPSHAAGDRELVPPLALAARAVGADGVMVEIHPRPEEALSDGPQALEFDQFELLMKELEPR